MARVHSLETRQKIAQSNTGKHHSEETKRLLSEIVKKWWQEPGRNRVMPEEIKKKISLSHMGIRPSAEVRVKIKMAKLRVSGGDAEPHLTPTQRYRKKHRHQCIQRTMKSNLRVKRHRRQEVLIYYGGDPPKCLCCGEKEKLFLTIDHIQGGGNKHRKEIRKAGGIAMWLVKNGFPEGFQVLCMNCNWGKYINSGKCPHKNG